MEEITNLMDAANTAVNNLENFIFEKKKEKYINLKTVTAYMESQIESAEMTIDLQDEEEYEEAKTRLNNVISKCEELIELFQTKDNIMVIINENGEIDIQEVNYENTQAPMESSMAIEIKEVSPEVELQNTETEPTPEANTSETNQPMPEEIPTIDAFATVPEIEIIDGPKEIAEEQVPTPDVGNVPEIQVPEISILDDTSTEMGNEVNQTEVANEETPDYSKDLDVTAVDAFLNNNEQGNTLTL